MGITGLIPFLEKASAKLQLKDIRGSTVAVDTYCWLHKGVFSCAEKLTRGEDTDLYVQYCLKYVQMLLSYDIKPILVFDGQHLPAKALTEKRRRESRQQSKKRAAELLRLGRVDEARSQMRRCVDVTHEMALRLIKECRIRNIDCIVAPYEADAQMAWLNKSGIAQYIITEDSDLTLFGAQKVIFKLDLTGSGLLVEAHKLHLAMGCSEEKYQFDKFRRMCILSGCDYLDSLPGIGLAKACKFMLKTEQDDMRLALKKIPQYLNMRNLEVNDEYIENFMKAEATFKHMYIYNPLERRMERLCELAETEEERYCSNAGTLLSDSEQALHLALGNLNPFTLKRLDSWQPGQIAGLQPPPKKQLNVKRAKHKSIWLTNDPSSEATETTQQPSCALFFKKVDFVGQTIDAEIESQLRQEKSKQTEAEVFCMYSFGAKRKRRNDSNSSNVSATEQTPPPSPSAQSKSRHNPFAKERTVAQLQRSPVVCENGSLLRMLSPKKCQEKVEADEGLETRLSALKRSIFAAKESPLVEVRSRFFATKPATPKANEVENNIKTPSPIKKLRQENESDNESEDLPERVVNDDDNDDASSIKKLRLDIESDDEAIVLLLSDEEETPPSSSQENETSSTPALNLKEFQQPSAKRVGLTRPKMARKTSKTITKTVKVDQNQPKLSMFGFQKRPVLKLNY